MHNGVGNVVLSTGLIINGEIKTVSAGAPRSENEHPERCYLSLMGIRMTYSCENFTILHKIITKASLNKTVRFLLIKLYAV